jgi:hypothetical protein
MLKRLLPRKTEFFDLFSRHADCSVRSAGLLRGLLADLAHSEERANQIRSVEHEADALCQQTMEMLHSSFVTPIERADILAISSRLDDIVDHIEATSQKLWLYEVSSPTPEVAEIRALTTAVKEAEKQNDRLLRRATARLFKEEQDPKTVIKWKEIYENLEEAIDRCEDVANVIEGVVLENA